MCLCSHSKGNCLLCGLADCLLCTRLYILLGTTSWYVLLQIRVHSLVPVVPSSAEAGRAQVLATRIAIALV